MDSKSKILNYIGASLDNFDFDDEKIHCTPTNLMIHNFWDASKKMDYDNIIYFIAPNQNFHPLNLFRNKHSKEQKNSTLLYG